MSSSTVMPCCCASNEGLIKPSCVDSGLLSNKAALFSHQGSYFGPLKNLFVPIFPFRVNNECSHAHYSRPAPEHNPHDPQHSARVSQSVITRIQTRDDSITLTTPSTAQEPNH